MAWLLSGDTGRGQMIADWDLWEVWLHENGREELYYDDNKTIREIRVYDRIYKRNVWYVGSRTQTVQYSESSTPGDTLTHI